MTFISFASGSSGNCSLVSDGRTNILIDAGISSRRICASLRAAGLSPGKLSAVVLTHEHSDHTSGLRVFSSFGVPVYSNGPTLRAVRGLSGCETGGAFYSGECFCIGTISVKTFMTPHDAPECSGFRFSSGGVSLGFATDLGHMTPEVLSSLCEADFIVLESNYDGDMLKNGAYPAFLKKRISGPSGHLANRECAAVLPQLFESGTRGFALAHLSRENNTPDTALASAESAFTRGKAPGISVLPRSEPSRSYIIEGHLCRA